ncbi:MAG: Ig-like domain-containing protein, partial [Rhabdochlamydiaceae bacterium]
MRRGWLIGLGLIFLLFFSPGSFFLATLPSFASSTPTTLSLSAPSTAEYETPFTVSATLTNSTSGAPISSESISFSVAYNGGSSSSAGSGTTSAGVASISYTPSKTGEFTFQATFAGDSNFAGSSSSTMQVNVTAIGGWGTQVSASGSEFVNAILNHQGSGWIIEQPTNFVSNTTSA